jgi:hypothetical protein
LDGLIENLEEYEFFPVMTKEDIKDRAKADAFTKAFACLQAGWLVVQSIARAVQHLSISQLELATLAFVLCALIMYLFWWNKPFNVERGTILICPTSRRELIINKLSLEDRPERQRRKNMSSIDLTRYFTGLYFKRRDIHSIIVSVILYAIGTIFSALHILAWNWEFPTPTSRLLWRIFATTSTGVAFVFPFAFFILTSRIKRNPDLDRGTTGFVILFSPLWMTYLVSRLALVVLVFYCFSSMPTNVYDKVNWAVYIPHVS